MESTAIKENNKIDTSTHSVHIKDLKNENTQETSLEKPNSKNGAYEWMLGVTPNDEEVDDDDDGEDADDENSSNNQVVRSFTGYSLQFKTWKKK